MMELFILGFSLLVLITMSLIIHEKEDHDFSNTTAWCIVVTWVTSFASYFGTLGFLLLKGLE